MTTRDTRQRREVSDEVAFHLDMRVRDLVAAGMEPAEARRRADAEWRAHGAGAHMENACVGLARQRDRRLSWAALTSGLAQDVRHAVRRLWRRRRVTAVAVMTMGLGIGAATAIYSVVDSVLLRPLPFPDPDRIVSVALTDERWRNDPVLTTNWDRVPLGRVEYDPLLTEAPALAAVGLYNDVSMMLASGVDGTIERIPVVRTTSSMWRVLQVRPARGRLFEPGEDVTNGPKIAVLSWEAWRGRFNADERIVGQSIVLDDEAYQVVGVLPAGVRMNRSVPPPVLWTPALQQPSDLPAQRNRSYRAVGRLAAGASIADAQRQAQAVFTASAGPHASLGARVARWQEDQTRTVRASLVMLIGAVGLLLAIASVNVAMVAIADVATRQHEVASRVALGASTGRLVRQWLTEGLVVALVAAPVGWAITWLGVEALLDIGPAGVPGLADTTLDGRALVFASLLLGTVGVIVGLAPALLFTRRTRAFTSAGTRHTSSGAARLQRSLIGIEIGLSFVLLVGCGLLGHSLSNLRDVEVGFDPARLSVVRVAATRAFWRDDDRVARYFEAAAADVATLPGVARVAAASTAPFSGSNSSSPIVVEGSDEAGRSTQQLRVGLSYFDVTGTPLLAGRVFTSADTAASERVVVVSASAAHRDFGDDSPIGRRVRWQGQWRTIVGVVGDVRLSRLSGAIQPALYAPGAQSPDSQLLIIRTEAAAPSLAAAIRQRVQALDRSVVVQSVDDMSDLIAASYAEDRYRVTLVTTFGLIASVLAAVGVFAVASRAVAARERETGIRIALGASAARVTGALTRDLARAIGAGLLLGACAAVPLARWLAPQLFGVAPLDALAFTAAAAILGTGVVLALIAPLRRALRIDPAEILRR